MIAEKVLQAQEAFLCWICSAKMLQLVSTNRNFIYDAEIWRQKRLSAILAVSALGPKPSWAASVVQSQYSSSV